MTLALGVADTRGPCPVCGAGTASCCGSNPPFLGRPEFAAVKRADGTMTTLRAKDDVFVDVPGVPGLRRKLYRRGERIREQHVELLSSVGVLEGGKQMAGDKAKRGPREEEKPSVKDGKVSRDKALRGPREPKKED